MDPKRALTRTLVKGTVSYAREDDSVADAASRLARENVGALPVLDRSNQLKGMITDRDIVVDVVAAGRDPMQTRVGDVSKGPLVTVGADEPVQRAIDLMAEHQIRRVPVVDGTQCIGVLSQADIARAMPAGDTGRLVGEISTE